MMRRRVLWAVILLPVVVLLAVMAVAGWLLFTDSGGRWALQQVPGLEVVGYEGSLGGAWRAERVVYDDGLGTRARVEGAEIAWSPGCLFTLELCVDRLHASRVALSLPEGEASEGAGEAIELPAIRLPLSVSVADLDVGRITWNDTLIIEAIESSATLSSGTLQLDSLRVTREGLDASAEGTLEMRGDWPVDLALDLVYDTGTDFPGEMDLTGELAGTVTALDVMARMSRPWQARLEGRVNPLEPGVPAQARLTAERFAATPDLPSHYALTDLVLDAQGDLEDGWSVEGDAVLATEPGLDVSLEGHTTTGQARIEQLTVSDGEGRPRSLGLNGARVSWAEGLTASGSLDWHYFPWQRLVPELPGVPVAVSDAGLDFTLEDGEYSGRLDAQLFTREGPVWLRTPIDGDFGRARFEGLGLASALGRATGNLGVGWSGGFEWRTDLALENLLPGRRQPELDGVLSGRLTSSGRMTDDGPDGNGRLELAGSLRGQALWLNTGVRLQGEQWEVPALELRFGDNGIRGSARQADQLQAELEWNLPVLAQFWSGLEGQLEGHASGRNLLGEPKGTMVFSAQDLELAEYGVELRKMEGEADLADDGAARARVDFSALEAREQQLESGQFRLAGSLPDHEMGLSLRHQQGSLRLSAAGAWGSEGWQGTLNGGGIALPGQHWLMATPARLTLARDGEAHLGAHCWHWGGARLCSGDQRLNPAPSLRLGIANLPTRAFQPFLPPTFRWEETLNAHASLELDEQGPRGRAWIDAGSGQVELRREVDPDNLDAEVDEQEGEQAWQWLPFEYNQLRVAADLGPERTKVTADLAGPEVGQLDLDTALRPLEEGMPVAGQLNLDALDLALIRPFLDLDTVEGQLAGRLDVSGPMASPAMQGEVTLSEGEIRDPRLPLPLSELGATARISGTEARINGDWRSGEKGQGRVEGTASWADGPRAELSLVAESLPVSVPPYAELTVFPDLMLRYGEDGVGVSGQVRVPSGSVVIESLPESAVGVSSDAVVEGEEPGAGPIPLSLDLDVRIGQERVDFNGFGVTGNLEGRLNLADDMVANGNLNLRNGRYQLYGQDLRIRRATLLFSGPIDRPFLDVEAVRIVDDVTAGIRLTGPADEPRSEIFSEPPMSQQQALAYLTLGRPLESEGDSYAMERAAINLGLARTAPLTREIGERVGIEDLQLETEGQGEDASVVASGYLTDRLSLRYGVGLFQPVSRMALRYDLSRNLYLEAASGLASSLDLFYQTDFGKPGD
ncbi:MAG: translocation/assembly module TamB domain-containing protein [Pseudomonadota bacterium]